MLCRIALTTTGRYHEGAIIIIDVSQAVEQSHPHALEFLRRDCVNVNGKGATSADEGR